MDKDREIIPSEEEKAAPSAEDTAIDNKNNTSEPKKEIENKKDEPKEKTEQKSKKKKRSVLKILLYVFFAIILSLFVLIVFLLINKPDNGANVPPPFDTEGLHETIPGLNELPEGESPLETETTVSETTSPTPQTTPKSEQDIYNFLIVGCDESTIYTDMIMLINFNTTTKNISVLQIPRDTYVQLSYYNGKINGLVPYHYITNNRDIKVALEKFASELEQHLCIKIHNYACINLAGVKSIVDTLGGIDVYVPAPMTYHDPRYKHTVTIYPGLQHLDGYQAEAFIRHRSTYAQADIGRIDAQKIFLSALLKKIKTDFNAATIIPLISDFFKYVTTDINLADGVFFARQMLDISMSDIRFMSMMGTSIGSNPDGTGLSIYVMARKNMREMIDKYFNIYDFPITDGIFDKNLVFTSKNYFPHVHKYYIRQDIVTPEPHDAQDINDNSISIPHF